MECLPSISCRPFYPKDASKQTTCSFRARITVIALGTISIGIGILLLYKMETLHRIGTTTGIVGISVGICLVLTATFLRRKEPIPSPPLCTEKIPKDVWLHIFSYLNVKEVGRLSLVCKSLSQISNDERIWQSFYERSAQLEIYAPYLKEKLQCSWKQAFRFAPLSTFLSSIEESTICSDQSPLTAYNPQLATINFLPQLYMPHFFVSHGACRFYIKNLKSIILCNEFDKILHVFEYEDKEGFTHIAAEGQMLFALQNNGKIIQWNYQTGKLIQTIESGIRSEIAPIHFYVKDGFIIVFDYSYRIRTCNIISYEDPKYRFSIPGHLFHNNPPKFLVQDKLLFILIATDILIWDLQKNKKNRTIDLSYLSFSADNLTDLTVVKDIIYTVDCKGRVFGHNLKTGWLLTKISATSDNRNLRYMKVIDDKLFIIEHDKESEIHVFKRDKGKLSPTKNIQKVSDLKTCTSHLHKLIELTEKS